MSEADLLANIESIEDNKDNLRRLIQQLETPLGVILFVGAGLSIPFGFPGWSDFLVQQARRAGIEDKIRQRLQAGEYEEAAGDLLQARGHQAFHDAIDGAFGVHKIQETQLQGAVSLLPRLAKGPVITTNFDHVLEQVFQEAGYPFEHVVWGVKADLATRALHENRRFLLKIHGDVEDSTDRILTRADYERWYGLSNSSDIDFSLPLPRLLQQMLIGRPLLFVGCSLRTDRTIAVLERTSEHFRSIAHYAIVEQPESRPQFLDRSRFLSNRNIRPIWYPGGQHNVLEPLLAYLVRETAPQGDTAGGPLDLFRDQATADVAALTCAYQQLAHGLQAPEVPSNELDAALKVASSLARTQIFDLAWQTRSDNWRDYRTKPLMERTIPVFRALIESDAPAQDHLKFGQLGFALKDQRSPNWAEAEETLSRAIELRGPWQDNNWLLYEFARALCRIHLDEAFGHGRAASAKVRAQILDDLRAAAAAAELKDLLLADPYVVDWLSLNHIPPPETEAW